MKQPNRWSCLPTAFAIASGEPLELILEIIGHDGSEIVHKDLPEPQCRRAFHVQECIWAMHQTGHTVTPFEAHPQLAASKHCIIDVPPPAQFFLIERYQGVLTGTIRGVKRHAVAFAKGWIYDPNGDPPVDFRNHFGYEIETLWLIK